MIAPVSKILSIGTRFSAKEKNNPSKLPSKDTNPYILRKSYLRENVGTLGNPKYYTSETEKLEKTGLDIRG